MKKEGLGKSQKAVLWYFDDEQWGMKPYGSIREISHHFHCLKADEEPTENQMNHVRKIVKALEKRGLVKIYRVKTKDKRIKDGKFQPVWYTLVTRPDFDVYSLGYEIFELDGRKRPL